MKRLTLVRVTEYNGGTFGVLSIDGEPLCVTCEDPWRDNERKISCIPEGRYKIRKHTSPRYGVCFRVDDVPERTHILVHAGNTSDDTLGCILLGTSFGSLGGKPAIVQSKPAVSRFMERMGSDTEAELSIVSAYGGGRVQ
jgi:hypothetical protein